MPQWGRIDSLQRCVAKQSMVGKANFASVGDTGDRRRKEIPATECPATIGFAGVRGNRWGALRESVVLQQALQ